MGLAFSDLSEGLDAVRNIDGEEAVSLIRDGKRVNAFGSFQELTSLKSVFEEVGIPVGDVSPCKNGSYFLQVNISPRVSLEDFLAFLKG